MSSTNEAGNSSPLILLGVTGSIAAYKSPQILRLLADDGLSVRVAMTNAATRFIGPLTFDALGGGPVYLDQLSLAAPGTSAAPRPSGIEHTDLTAVAEALLIAPATADIIAKVAHGLGDDPVSALALAMKRDAALVVAPAMNPRMWANPAVRANIALIRERGAIIVGPAEGDMACGDMGTGRMSEPEEIVSWTRRALSRSRKPTELRVLILSGPTREPIDDVRFLSNGSSGRMGRALAESAFEAGHDVTVISGPSEIPMPHWIRTIRVNTALEMLAESKRIACDLVISPAAIADFSPAHRETGKPPKDASGAIEWVATPDVLAALQKHWSTVIRSAGPAAEDQTALAKAKKSGVLATPMAVSTMMTATDKTVSAEPDLASLMRKSPVVVAFAAEESEDDFAKAVEKAGRKGARAIVLNEVLSTMGSTDAKVKFIDVHGGSVTAIGPGPKKFVAREILRLATSKA